jgi:hypothetical protein
MVQACGFIRVTFTDVELGEYIVDISDLKVGKEKDRLVKW